MKTMNYHVGSTYRIGETVIAALTCNSKMSFSDQIQGIRSLGFRDFDIEFF